MAGRRKKQEREISKEDVLRSIQKAEGRSANLHQLLLEFDATPLARRQIKDILTQLVKRRKDQPSQGKPL